ncbi:MAG: IS1595 family transposase [Acidobacteriaceae bacterium]|jgi:transposase-like protein
MENELKTLSDAIRYFSDEQVCIDTVADMRWPRGPVCPACVAHESRQHWLKNQKRWQCRECGKQYSVKVNTIFEDSAVKLDKWLTAMWLLANCKNGISSYEIARSVGVTQKSAWFMLQRIRLAMKNQSVLKLGSGGAPVEMDETFIGGKVGNMHKAKRATLGGKKRGVMGKAIVVGMLERKGRVKAEIVMERTQPILRSVANKHLAPGTSLVTDEWGGYAGINFEHAVVNHAVEYVNGQVHTQGIENFWSLLKRSLGGTYISVEPFHLDRYVDEQAFRYNNRATADNPVSDADRFAMVLSQISGRRLTYAELTGKVGDPQV